MRLIRVPTGKSKEFIRLINAEAVTDIVIYPCPDDSAYTEVSVSFGESYSEFRFRNIGDARQLVADIAGQELDSMMRLLAP